MYFRRVTSETSAYQKKNYALGQTRKHAGANLGSFKNGKITKNYEVRVELLQVFFFFQVVQDVCYFSTLQIISLGTVFIFLKKLFKNETYEY